MRLAGTEVWERFETELERMHVLQHLYMCMTQMQSPVQGAHAGSNATTCSRFLRRTNALIRAWVLDAYTRTVHLVSLHHDRSQALQC